MNRKTVSGIMLTLLLIGTLTFSSGARPARAVSTNLYINPATVSASPGEVFTVDINVADVELLYAWQVNMSFDPSVLEFVNVTEGDFLKDQPEGTSSAIRDDHKQDGWVMFGWCTRGAYLGVSGSGTLVTVEFLALALGESVLRIDNALTKLLGVNPPPLQPGEPHIYEIPYTAENGYFIACMHAPQTVAELKTKIEELGSEGEIDNQGIVRSLLAKLNVAQKLVDKGKIDQAKTILEAFIPQVQNLSGIHIAPEAADILIESAEYIISHL